MMLRISLTTEPSFSHKPVSSFLLMAGALVLLEAIITQGFITVRAMTICRLPTGFTGTFYQVEVEH